MDHIILLLIGASENRAKKSKETKHVRKADTTDFPTLMISLTKLLVILAHHIVLNMDPDYRLQFLQTAEKLKIPVT